MRIATWNLQRPTSKARTARIRAMLKEIDADVWVLTETRSDLSPGPEYVGFTSAASDRAGHLTEVWTAIWSRLQTKHLPVSGDPARTAAVCVSAHGNTLPVFGTVLPWAGSRWRDLPSSGGVAFEAALQEQSADWRSLSADHGGLCVAGDFNQDLAQQHYYWSKVTRESLQRALSECGLHALTGGAEDPVRLATEGHRASIDHICLSGRWRKVRVQAWAPVDDAGTMSDHFGVYADVEPVEPQTGEGLQ